MLPFTFSCFRNQYQGASAGICDLLGNCLTLVHSCSTSTAMLSQMEWNDFHFLTLFQTPSLWQFTLTCNIWTTVLLLFNLFNNVMPSQTEWLSLSLIVSNTFIISFHFQPWNIRKSTPFPSKEVGPHNLSQRNSYCCTKTFHIYHKKI